MENVLSVKTELIAPFLPKSGIATDHCAEVLEQIMQQHEFLPRAEAENDPSHKQIIPYVVLCRGEQVFVMRRLNKGGEKRLHGLLSLGVGGHINPEADGDGGDVLRRGMLREISEEVSIEKMLDFTARGMINDDTNEVGRVHMGLFYTLEVEGAVAVLETEKLEGFWAERRELPELSEQMEHWSRLVIPVLV
ncbi:MAG: NUDIX domain-containing protein [Oscillospiraceae bacterium]